MVDNRTTSQRRTGQLRPGASRGQRAAPMVYYAGTARRNQTQYQRLGNTGQKDKKDWKKPQRLRESSVKVGSSWNIIEEIEFSRLGKLMFDVGDGEDIETWGKAPYYDKTYDRVSTRNEKPLVKTEKVKLNPTASEDPILLKVI